MTRRIWQFPWGYIESALFATGIAAAGFALQLTVGYFDFYLLHFPANLVALALLLVLIALAVRFENTPFVRWLSGIPCAVALIAALLVLALYMTLTPQLAHPPAPAAAAGLIARLGFARVTASWPFVLLYAATLLALGVTVARRVYDTSRHPSHHTPRHDFAFLCNHLGLWILLAAAGCGAADMQRAVMYVREGETEWRVFDRDGTALPLPLAIELKDFTLEEYPPKLALIDRQTNTPQPEAAPAFLQIDPARPRGRLGDWEISIDEYLHEAVRIDGEFRASPMPASTPAARVTAKNLVNGKTRRGWICGGGNVLGFYAALTLDERHFLAMTEPEPKRYASDIVAFTPSGERIAARLEVNKPLTIGGWTIYQYSYDTAAGKMSSYSGFELVRDPWLLPAQIGMGIMALGALSLIGRGAGTQRAGTRQ
ncbi:MAG: cytochrome c biogenesis protein ResB [Azoarcus sp.]|jgi:hypothetical protein|nr:cytochrome c biogenesis protein ResB [Azoarcus sp.]